MITVIFTLIGSMLLVGFLLLCLRLRIVSNGMLKLASQDFDAALTSLLRDLSEVPDTVVELLEVLNSTAFHPGSHTAFYRSLASNTSSTKGAKFGNEFGRAFDGMRPELQELVAKALHSWLGIICHRSVFVGIAINTELKRAALKRGKLSERVTDEAMVRALPALAA